MNQLLAAMNALLALVMGRSASAKGPRRLAGSPAAGRSEHPAPSASIITAGAGRVALGKVRRPIVLGALLLALVTLLLSPGGPVLPQFAEAQTAQTTLVANTGQSPSSTAVITQQYAMGFRLGKHGQGYEISGVGIDLAAVPSDLTVSLWIGSHPGHSPGRGVQRELFEFTNPASFRVGLNKFTAPAGAFAYPNIDYWIVLSGFNTSLSIKQTTSDGEDAGGEPGASLSNSAKIRALGSTGRWASSSSRGSVLLLLAVEGSRRDRGILASSFAQPWGSDQEIISAGDDCCFDIRVGSADRYLIRGLALASDNTTNQSGFFGLPFEFKQGANQLFTLAYASAQGELVSGPESLVSPAGISEWAAPQGATVAGGSSTTYTLKMVIRSIEGDDTGSTRGGVILSRIFGRDDLDDTVEAYAHDAQYYDTPKPPGVTFTDHGDVVNEVPHMAVLGEPLFEAVSNLGQTDSGYHALGSANNKVVSQGFTTGSDAFGRLLGIGVNVEGSNSEFPDGPDSVSVAVHADASGLPGDKLFDLVSPAEYGAGHHFFEAPAGKTLEPETSYVMVWSHVSGTNHRLVKTLGDGEDSPVRRGSSIADAFYHGADLSNLSVSGAGSALEIVVYTDAAPRNATGRPRVFPSAIGAGNLFADISQIADPDGLRYLRPDGNPGDPDDGSGTYDGTHGGWSFQWIRVDGVTAVETIIGGSLTYLPVEADVGNLIKVRVSFTDKKGFAEVVTSLPFGPLAKLARPSEPPTTLVGNAGQTPSATTAISGVYTMGFRLGTHGQGYEITGVSIDLAAVPSSLTVSLYIAGHPELPHSTSRRYKLFDFTNPSSFKVGLNRFTAPEGAFAYQNINYFLVLSNYGASLSIKETTSDGEDTGGDTGAILSNDASSGGSGVLRLAVEGSRRDRGILAANYAQPGYDPVEESVSQEIISVGDRWSHRLVVGAADRFLVRGLSFFADDTTNRGGGFTNPFDLRSGWSDATGGSTGTKLFTLYNTHDVAGMSVWTAPQGATVAGDATYDFVQDLGPDRLGRWSAILSRTWGPYGTGHDTPTAPGATLDFTGDAALPEAAYVAIVGEPLDAMVSNLGRTDNNEVALGDTDKVLSQGFTTGSNATGYRLQGIGVNIEGSGSQYPDGRTSVSVSVHEDASGLPGAKLFDLVSPTEYGPGHSFFEAPPRTRLGRNTDYVLVWRHLGGTEHRLMRTAENGVDAGAAAGSGIANEFYAGSDLNSLTVDSAGDALEFAVYTDVAKVLFVAGAFEVRKGWLHIPEDKNGKPLVEAGGPVPAALRHTRRHIGHVREHRRLQPICPGGCSREHGPGRTGRRSVHPLGHSEDRFGFQGGGLHRSGRRANEHRDDGWHRRADPLAGRRLGESPHADRRHVRRVLRRPVDEPRQGRLRDR